MIDLSEYDKYLEPCEDGLRIADESPQNIKDELRRINDEYKSLYGVDLIKLQNG